MCFKRFSAVFGDFEFFPYPNHPLTFSHSPPKITKTHQKPPKTGKKGGFSLVFQSILWIGPKLHFLKPSSYKLPKKKI